MSATNLDKEFKIMSEKVKKMNRPTDTDALELYGFYKQATIGDCNTDKPCDIDLMACAKWNAWQAKRGLSQDKAKEGYVKKGSMLGLILNEIED